MVSSKSASGAGFSASEAVEGVEAVEATAMDVDALMDLVDLDMDSLPGNGVDGSIDGARAATQEELRRSGRRSPCALNERRVKTMGGKL
jgi:hypothetical protein